MLATSIVDDSSARTENVNEKVKDEYEKLIKEDKRVDSDYEKDIKKIANKDNVEKHAKNETLSEIKDQLEDLEKEFYKSLNLIYEKSINVAKKTKAKSKEFNLVEYYLFDLGERLSSLNEILSNNNILSSFSKLINEFANERFYIEKYKKSKVEDKIKDYLRKLEKGTTNANKLFEEITNNYNSTKSIEELEKELKGLSTAKKLDNYEAKELINKLLFLFKFYFNIDETTSKKYIEQEYNLKEKTANEGIKINNYLEKIWKRYKFELSSEIKEIENSIERLSIFSNYSIIDYNGYDARLYVVPSKTKCESKETDPYLNPKSKYTYKDIEYWFKYCSFATLASVLNPVSGWSTGWIVPTPILFPVIYVPIKSIMTNYGFIVLGISICGIYVFPFNLFVNLSTNNNTPLGDPIKLLKNEINELKKKISEQLNKLRKEEIKKILDETKKELDENILLLKKTQKEYENNKLNKPQKYINGQINEDENYLTKYKFWLEKNVELKKNILELKTIIWKLEKKYKILNDAYKRNKSVKGSGTNLEQSEEIVQKQLDNLETLIDKTDEILGALPISMKPESANFGMTLKNPKPIIKIANELDDNVNVEILDNLIKKFRLKNEDLMSTNYKSKLSNSILNYKMYKNILSANMMTIVKKDPFPSYSLMNPVNLPWIAFLYKDFVKVGSTTFGFPSFSPFPI